MCSNKYQKGGRVGRTCSSQGSNLFDTCMCTLHVVHSCMHEHEQLKKKKIEFLTFCMSYVKIL